MIIDLILDRRSNIITGKKRKAITLPDGSIAMQAEIVEYSPKRFYNDVMSYYGAMPEIVEPIARALDSGTEAQIKKELSKYILDQDYNIDIITYIYSVEWL